MITYYVREGLLHRSGAGRLGARWEGNYNFSTTHCLVAGREFCSMNGGNIWNIAGMLNARKYHARIKDNFSGMKAEFYGQAKGKETLKAW